MLHRVSFALLIVSALLGAGVAASSPAAAHVDRDCPDFASQRAAQIYFIAHGGPRRDPDRLDRDGDGIVCEDNPAPYWFHTYLPPRHTAVRLSVSATKRIAGEPLTFRVRVSPHHVRTVVLQRLSGSRWVKVHSGHANRHGYWRYSTHGRSASTTYRARVTAATISRRRYATGTSSRRAVTAQPQSVTLNLPAQVTVGDPVRGVVIAGPARYRRTVLLQQKKSGRWTTIKRASETRKGRAAFALSSSKVRDAHLRAVVAAAHGAVAARSSAHELQVNAPDVPPGPPTGVQASSGDRTAVVSWDASPAPDLNHYVLHQSDASDGPWTDSVVEATSTPVTGLKNGQVYYFSVSVVDNAGHDSSPSTVVSVTPTDTEPPPAPTSLQATGGDGHADLTWTASGAADLDSYSIYQADSEDGPWTAISTAAGTNASVSGLTDGGIYWFRVTALDDDGNESVPSAATSVQPQG